jgi:hypothetical protein
MRLLALRFLSGLLALLRTKRQKMMLGCRQYFHGSHSYGDVDGQMRRNEIQHLKAATGRMSQ